MGGTKKQYGGVFDGIKKFLGIGSNESVPIPNPNPEPKQLGGKRRKKRGGTRRKKRS